MTRQRARSGEQGLVSVWLLLTAAALTLLVGLAVDLSGQVDAQQRARALAGEAARAGAQALDPGTVSGGAVLTSRTAAVTAARTYLAGADVPGSVVVAGDTVTVTVRQTFGSRVLSAVGIGPLSVSGTGQAQARRVVEGVAQ